MCQLKFFLQTLKSECLFDHIEIFSLDIFDQCHRDRSTIFNISLGEERAEAVRDYLVNLGVEATKLSIVSYGEEKPLDSGSSEASWARNRRVEFSVQ